MQAAKTNFSFSDSLRFLSKSEEASEKSGPRAAIYKGEMGKSQKKAQKMQTSNVSKPTYVAPKNNLSLTLILEKFTQLSRFTKVLLSTVCAIVITVTFLYAPAKSYYTQVRNTDKLQAEYEAVLARNEQLKNSVNNLETPEGVESQAIEELGYVKQGEGSALVNGIEDASKKSSALVQYVNSDDIKAPKTWYSDICDVIFGYVN